MRGAYLASEQSILQNGKYSTCNQVALLPVHVIQKSWLKSPEFQNEYEIETAPNYKNLPTLTFYYAYKNTCTCTYYVSFVQYPKKEHTPTRLKTSWNIFSLCSKFILYAKVSLILLNTYGSLLSNFLNIKFQIQS